MYFTSLCIAFILFLYGVSTNSTTDYTHQMELKISHLESHSLASEQKQAAVLSSILSMIQSQEQGIQSLNQTLQSYEQKMYSQDHKIQSQDQKIQSQNQTLQSYEQKIQSQDQKIHSQDQKIHSQDLKILSQGQKMHSQERMLLSQGRKMHSQDLKIQSQEQKIQELKSEVANVTKTASASSGSHQVVFEARTSRDFDATSRIHFDQISTNVGEAYSSHTDVFTAPRNGTYQIWFNVKLDIYHSRGPGPVVKVIGGAGATIYSSKVATQELVDNRHEYKVLQGVLAVSLVKGDQVYLTLSLYQSTRIKSESTFGGVFLGDM